MTFKVILKVTGVNFPVQADVNFKVICRSNVDIKLKIQHFQRRNWRRGLADLQGHWQGHRGHCRYLINMVIYSQIVEE